MQHSKANLLKSIILKLSFTQEMRRDSDPQPRDTASLSHSDLNQQNGTPSVDLPSIREDMVSKYFLEWTRQTCFRFSIISTLRYKHAEDSILHT